MKITFDVHHRTSVSQCLYGLVVLLALLGSSKDARADLLATAITDGEWAMLPEYCIDTQAGPFGGPEGGEALNRSPRARKWVGLMGGDFWHLHHYCYALRDLKRAEIGSASPNQKKQLFGRAIGDIAYVIRHSQPTMPLMPEVHLRLGDTLLLSGDLVGAQVAYENSRKLKPDYWPAYTRWIDVLIQLKQFDKARALAEQGLARSPDNAELKQRLAAMGRGAAPSSSKRSASASAAARVPR